MLVAPLGASRRRRKVRRRGELEELELLLLVVSAVLLSQRLSLEPTSLGDGGEWGGKESKRPFWLAWSSVGD